MIIYDFYNEDELNLIWEELNFYTKPNKLLEAKDYGGVIGGTNAKALDDPSTKYIRIIGIYLIYLLLVANYSMRIF